MALVLVVVLSSRLRQAADEVGWEVQALRHKQLDIASERRREVDWDLEPWGQIRAQDKFGQLLYGNDQVNEVLALLVGLLPVRRLRLHFLESVDGPGLNELAQEDRVRDNEVHRRVDR